MPRIKILSGIRSGEVFDLSGERVSFGRNRGSTVRILDSWISWDHARLVRQGETWWLEDQGSANGTYVNEAAITRAALNDQDVFALGKTQVRFLASDGAPAAGAERVAPPPPLPAAPPEPEVPGPDALGPGHTRRLPRLPSEERPAVPAGRDPAPRPAVRSTPFSRGRQGSAAEAASPPPKAEVAEAPPAVPGPQGEAGAAAGRAAPFSRGRRTTWLGTVVDESQAAGTGAAPGAQEVATPRGRSAGAPKGRITITRGPRPARPSGEVPAAAAPAARDAPPPDAPAPAGGRTLRNHPLLRGRKSRTGEVALPAGLPRAEAPPPLVAPTAELAVPVETGELGALQGERPAAPPPERPGPSPRVR
ncbi:MAG: FHA domain-containing protein, partial [Planctomycetes bacterium]|nr:FHA domain-containing protein [Planctomycetota bacterium]